jgi:hypothetical protein
VQANQRLAGGSIAVLGIVQTMEVFPILTSQLESRARPDGVDLLRLVGKISPFSRFFSQFQSSFLTLPTCIGYSQKPRPCISGYN